MSYFGVIESPFTEALRAVTGQEPPEYTHGLLASIELDEDRALALQDWCSDNARPSWATGMGIIEAAELLVHQAIGNDNIEVRRVDEVDIGWIGAV